MIGSLDRFIWCGIALITVFFVVLAFTESALIGFAWILWLIVTGAIAGFVTARKSIPLR